MRRVGTRASLTFKVLNQRVAFLGLIAAAVILMIFGKTETPMVEQLRTRVVDLFVPVIEAVGRPLGTVGWTADRLGDVANVHAENARLREDNQRLLQWEQYARRLDGENQRLRELLQVRPDPEAQGLTARVIADAGGSFARSIVVAAGARDNLQRGHIALAAEGLVGRVSDVGDRGARVLLITDLNSNVPVLIERTRQRALLSGDNSARPRLVIIGGGGQPEIGDRLITSGHGGVFPPGLPVATVVAVGEDSARAQPLVDLGRLEFVRVVDFGLQGLIPPVPQPAPRRPTR